MTVFLQAFHSLVLSLWVGGMVTFSFLVTPVFFQKLSREQAGEMVGLLFPRYWLMGYISSGAALASYLWLRFILKSPPWGDAARITLLVLMLAGAVVNGAVVAAKAHDVKAQMAGAAESAKAALQQEFGKLHGISMALNLAVILAGLSLVAILATHPLQAAGVRRFF